MMVRMFIAVGFEDEAGNSPDCEPAPEFEWLLAAAALARDWNATRKPSVST